MVAEVPVGRERPAHNFGAIRPNPIANRIRIAVEPSARTARARLGGVLAPSSAICTSPAAIRKRKTPGISETTAVKAIAAKGSRRRLASGVITSPTKRQARNAAAYTFAPIESEPPYGVSDHSHQDRNRKIAPWHRIEGAVGGDRQT